MTVPLPVFLKERVQALIPAVSFGLVRQQTDALLSGATACVLGIRGLGWSPSVSLEARGAARWINPNEDFVAIDAGANVGSWLVALRKYLPRGGHLYAFEPQPAAAENIRNLQIPGCEVHQLALSDRPGPRVFYTSAQTDTMGSLYEHGDTLSQRQDKNYGRIEIQAIRLDDFVTEHGIARIDFMKMDLEGAEFEALQGATECMRSGLLRALSFEFGVSNVNARVFFRDLFHLLTANRFELFRMTPAGQLIRLHKYSEDFEIFARTSTYFARKSAAV